ncbi:tripartite tricarboxylate transporter permease, partial [Desulfovibrio sp. OttesenSCG-928-C06]|nr:tripartite tricarboxylate transporter permease [Desulfovibrio sp. OttesenSCG-928-C06]
ILTWEFGLFCLLGSVAGLLVGALPGFSVTMGTALLISITYGWPAHLALATMLGVYVSGVYAGAFSAILINIPGAPSSVATSLDGFPMARRGEAARALWVATFHSLVGSLVGFIVLGCVAEYVARVALNFAAIDYFLLGLLGLSVVGSLSGTSIAKGWIAAVIGLLLSLVGQDPIDGAQRFTFGQAGLLDGIGIIPVMIGLFGFAEILGQIGQGGAEGIAVSATTGARRSIAGQMRFMGLSVRSALIGVGVGALPGVGAPVASLLAYSQARKSVKNPERPFGTGAPEGVVASEAANNGCVGGALIPMLTLAIPGDAVTAVMLAGFTVHGLRPGPMLFMESPELLPLVVCGGVLASLLMFGLGVTVVPFMSRIVLIPKRILLGVVALVCVIGAYAARGGMFDVWVMLAFGLGGYVMKKRGYPIAPVVLGLVLGSMMDANFRRAVNLALSSDNFLTALIGRPSSICLLALLALYLVGRVRGRGKAG